MLHVNNWVGNKLLLLDYPLEYKLIFGQTIGQFILNQYYLIFFDFTFV